MELWWMIKTLPLSFDCWSKQWFLVFFPAKWNSSYSLRQMLIHSQNCRGDVKFAWLVKMWYHKVILRLLYCWQSRDYGKGYGSLEEVAKVWIHIAALRGRSHSGQNVLKNWKNKNGNIEETERVIARRASTLRVTDVGKWRGWDD